MKHEPAAVLSRTNRLMSDLDPSLFATCCYLSVDARSGRATVALAGHPPPLRRCADGTVEALTAPVGAPLGVAPDTGVTVYANSVPIHRARPGSSSGRRAVEILERLEPEA